MRDSWRNNAKAVSREEASKFSLASLSLRHPEMNIFKNLYHTIKSNNKLLYRIERKRLISKRINYNIVDIVGIKFNNGKATEINPFFDPEHKISNDIEKNKLFVSLYNKTLNKPDLKRPRILKKELLKQAKTKSDKEYFNRLLSADFVQIISQNSQAKESFRFDYPQFSKTPHPGFGLLNIIVKQYNNPEEIDLWIQFDHLAVDPKPMQEFMNDIKMKWGEVEKVVLPAPQYKYTKPIPSSTPYSQRQLVFSNATIDFAPVKKAKKKLIRKYPELNDNINIVGMLSWVLGQHDLFKNKKFIITIDVPPKGKHQRTLSAVYINPNKYFNSQKKLSGFIDYTIDLKKEIEATKNRISSGFKFQQKMAYFPAFLFTLILKYMPNLYTKVTGSVNLTIVKDREIFISSCAENIREGIISIGNFNLDTVDNKKAGTVCVNTNPKQIHNYYEALFQTIKYYQNIKI